MFIFLRDNNFTLTFANTIEFYTHFTLYYYHLFNNYPIVHLCMFLTLSLVG